MSGLPTKPCIWLDRRCISAALQPQYRHHGIHLFAGLPSTNDYLKRLARSPYFKQQYSPDKVIICLAEYQTAGKGQWRRQWYSPVGENIYLSLLWQSSRPVRQLNGLSIHLGRKVINCLQQLGMEGGWQLKHPNDVLWEGGKLAGILVETVTQHEQTCQVIAGIGLNVNMLEASTIDQPWTSLQKITQSYWNRNQVVAKLLNHMLALTFVHEIEQFL